MKLIKSTGVCLFLAAFFAFGSAEVMACAKCAIPSFDQAKVRAKAIFVGKVIGVTEEGSSKIFEFQVTKLWKGESKSTLKVTYYEAVRYQPIFEIGKEYLMFAESGDDKNLHVYRCSRSADIENANDDLKSLGKAATIKPKTKVKKVKVKSVKTKK